MPPKRSKTSEKHIADTTDSLTGVALDLLLSFYSLPEGHPLRAVFPKWEPWLVKPVNELIRSSHEEISTLLDEPRPTSDPVDLEEELVVGSSAYRVFVQFEITLKHSDSRKAHRSIRPSLGHAPSSVATAPIPARPGAYIS